METKRKKRALLPWLLAGAHPGCRHIGGITMLYHEFKGKKLSALGMGCMRLPHIGEGDSAIDEEGTAALVELARQKGINYFDTAWGYHGGNSEIVMGKILRQYPRDSYYFATKFPSFETSFFEDPAGTFERQMEKTGLDHFDFYLLHNVWEKNADDFLDPRHGVLDYVLRQKEAGRIGHLGFSCHGKLELLSRFLEAAGEHMEFGMLQLNWLDWTYQRGAEKAALLRVRGIPLWIMEPLRGGALCRLPEKDRAALAALHPDWSLPRWAMNFVRDVPGPTMVLSGMSAPGQVEENAALFSADEPLTQADRAALEAIAGRMTAGVPCTACRYCVDHCPRKLDIPKLLEAYNDGAPAPAGEAGPSACVGCKACEKVCPQDIKISSTLAAWTGKKDLS